MFPRDDRESDEQWGLEREASKQAGRQAQADGLYTIQDV